MYFRRCSREEMYRALSKANEQYEGNLILTEPTRSGSIRLRTVKGGVLGSRTTVRGVKLPNASWEAHRDFLIALFEINPNASVRTKFAHYDGKEKFYELYPATGYENIGSQMEPCTMPECTYEPVEYIKHRCKPGARKEFYALAKRVRQILGTRALLGEFDGLTTPARMSDTQYLSGMVRLVESTDKEQRWWTTEEVAPLFYPRPRYKFGTERSTSSYEWTEHCNRPAMDRLDANIKFALTAWERQHANEELWVSA